MKRMAKSVKRNSEQAARVKIVAKLTGYSRRYVYLVIDSSRNNETIMTTYMNLYEGQNKLLQAVKDVLEPIPMTKFKKRQKAV